MEIKYLKFDPLKPV
ncbi:hypothetical protein [Brevibacillus panacihumi]